MRVFPPLYSRDHGRQTNVAAYVLAQQIFDGLMPVTLAGHEALTCNLWEDIARYRGVDNLLLDLAERPDFMHATVRRFVENVRVFFKQMEEQDLLDSYGLLIHCTPACARELPAPDFTGYVRPRDVRGRCAAIPTI